MQFSKTDIMFIMQYYYEPGTGLKFRSLREVERRLNGEIFAPRSRALVVRHNQASVRVEYFKKICVISFIFMMFKYEYSLSYFGLFLFPSSTEHSCLAEFSISEDGCLWWKGTSLWPSVL